MASPQPKRPAASEAPAGSTKKSKKSEKSDAAGASKDAAPKAPKPLNEEAILQRSLLESSKELKKVFMQLLSEKPPTISSNKFVRDFWASRQHLLKAHAAEKEQGRGRYNVLSVVKPKVAENTMKISAGKEHVREILRMYPIVQTAYNDLTDPAKKDKMGESEFWAAFFTSRLCKKLRGERIRDDDSRNARLDKYLEMSEEEVRIALGKQAAAAHVPHYIDLEGNEQNTKHRGNAPDWDMRQDVLSNERLPIIRQINATSEKIMVNSDAADPGVKERHAPVGMDEGTWKELQLRDLQGETGEDRVRLNINDQQSLHKRGRASTKQPKERPRQPPADPKTILHSLHDSAQTTSTGSLDLSTSINFPSLDDDADMDDPSDSEDESTAPSATSPALLSLRAATAQIQSLIAPSTPFTQPPNEATTAQIADSLHYPASARDHLTDILLTHQTTTEFLHYFWSLITVRGPTLATELPSLMGALEKSLGRLRSQAEAAETVRKGRLEELRKEAAERGRQYRVKVVVDERRAGPGKGDVEVLVGPLMRAVEGGLRRGRVLVRELG